MRIRDEHIFLLAWAAGCLDTISYLGLGNVFTANMTGNTVLLGIALAQGDGQAILLTGMALLGFCIGVFSGGLCIEWHNTQAIWTRQRIVVLVLDVALLVLFGTIWLAAGVEPHPKLAWFLLLCATLAMGLQSALTLSLAFPGVSTTYFTGTLTNLMAGVARLFHVTIRPRPDSEVHAEVLKDGHSLGRLVIMWLVFSLATLVSSVLFKRIPPAAICSPLVANLLVVFDVLLRQYWQKQP